MWRMFLFYFIYLFMFLFSAGKLVKDMVKGGKKKKKKGKCDLT